MSRPRLSRVSLPFWCCLLGIPTCVELLEGIRSPSLGVSLLAGALLGALYMLIRPALRLLTFPIGCLTLGLFGLGMDAAFFLLLPRFIPGFQVASPEWALLAALLINGACAIAMRAN